jgi:hypothetical protein
MLGADQANLGAGGGTLRLTANSFVETAQMPSSVFISAENPFIDISTAQAQTQSAIGGTYPTGYKGIVQGLSVVTEGYLNATGLTSIIVKVRDNNPDIRIVGNVISGLNPHPTFGGKGTVGIQSGGLNCLVQGNIITGASAQSAQNWNIFASRGIDGGGNIVNTPIEKQIF